MMGRQRHVAPSSHASDVLEKSPLAEYEIDASASKIPFVARQAYPRCSWWQGCDPARQKLRSQRTCSDSRTSQP
eukprot:1277797-Pyramimonas_sp.AAC.1